MPTKLDIFLNGNPNGSERERKGHKVEENGKPFTHWSFENRQKWFIDEDDLDEFRVLYCKDVKNGERLFLTEKSTPIGMVRVDLDISYDHQVDEHRHTRDQIKSFTQAFMDELQKLVQIPESVEIFALEKDSPTYDTKKKIWKSGIHLQIPQVKTRAEVENEIRRRMLKKNMETFFGTDLGLCNKWEDVYDKQPLSHTNNWPLLGSKKPDDNSQPYQLRYKLIWNNGDITISDDVPDSIRPELLKIHTVRSKPEEETPLTEEGEGLKRSPPPEDYRSQSRGRSAQPDVPGSRSSSPGRNYIEPLSETRKKYIEEHVKNLGAHRYDGHHNDWYAVCQCLKNIHPDLADVFLDFMANASDLERRRKAVVTWDRCTFRVDGERLGMGTLRFWSKEDNLEGYLDIESRNVDRLVDESAVSGTEFDVAQVIYAKYRDDFKCAQFKNNDWYHWVNHIWRNTENGVELQRRLSIDIARLYLAKENVENTNLQNIGPCPHTPKDPDPSCQTCQTEKRKKQYGNAYNKLKTTKFKENVMKECRALFFDKDFAKKLDDNKHLIAFNNGIYDTLTQTFREGRPEDCISFCTNIDFAIDTQYHQFSCWSELEKFLKSVLPHKNVREYFLKHLATCLSGVFTQTFHILTGSGSNGKSMLMNLMSTCFGDYCYKANIAMFTQKRGKAGAASPEMIRMKGRRFVMMSEPDEDTPLSTGFMKEITSSEKISGRDLFQGSKQMEEFDVQAKCHLACNEKPKVNTTDGGTWRRLRVIDFPNKFVSDPKLPNELPMDETIMQKVLSVEWAECFMAYLVHLHMEGKGLTKLTPPKEVEAYTNEYKEESDGVAKFMSEYIHPAGPTTGDGPADGISWTMILAEFNAWKRSNDIAKASVVELRKRLEKEYGKLPSGGWTSFRFGSS